MALILAWRLALAFALSSSGSFRTLRAESWPNRVHFDGSATHHAQAEDAAMRIMLSQYLPNLAQHLIDRGNQVSWLAPPSEFAALDQSNTDASNTLGTPYEYDGSRAKVSLQSVREMRRAIEAEKPDLVHAFLGRPLAHLILATAGMKERPRIVSFRGITARPTYGDPANWISYLHRRVDAHACESEAVRQAMIAGGVSPEKCRTVYNFVPVIPAEPPADAEQFGIPSNAFIIGSVASVRPVKGIDILLRAMKFLDDLDDLRLLLVGQVRDRRVARLLRDPAIAGRVHATGFRGDARQLMQLMQVFVMPSRAEALCRAVLEAMNCERCMVVSDAGGLKEAVRQRQDGLVVARKDPIQLAEAIRELYHSPELRTQYARSAKERASSFFSPEQWSERLTGLYEDVLERRSLLGAAATDKSRRAA